MQQNKIAAWFVETTENPEWVVELINSTDFPVTKLILATVDIRGKPTDGRKSPPGMRAYLRILPPGKWYTVLAGHMGMNFVPGIEMAFVDWHGRTWLKDGLGNLKQLKIDPLSYFNVAEPVSWENPLNQRP
jgi:hypothetical protein